MPSSCAVTSLQVAPRMPRVTLLARDIDRANPQARLALEGSTLMPGARDPPPAWISEAAADRYGWRVGQVVALPLADRNVPFTVAGVWRDYARQQGAIAIERATYSAATGDVRSNDAALWLAPGAALADVRARIETLAGAERLEFSTPGELRAISLRIFDRTFAVTYALEAVAVLIGLTGLSSSFGALVLARRREFGVLRHIGMTRGQVGAMLASEGLALGAVGVTVGLALGFVIALILIRVVNRQSFHWSMDIAVPWSGLGALALALLVLSTLTARLSGRAADERERGGRRQGRLVKRRSFLAAGALIAWPVGARAETAFAPVVARPLVFPRDHGSHPAFRTEWWYITGWTRDETGVERGVQITFFRSRPGVAEDLKSALAPRQIIFAHAAIADARVGHLLHDQRAARAVLRPRGRCGGDDRRERR